MGVGDRPKVLRACFQSNPVKGHAEVKLPKKILMLVHLLGRTPDQSFCEILALNYAEGVLELFFDGGVRPEV